MATKFRLVITDVLGYKLSVLQRRFLWIFWKKIAEKQPNETTDNWYDRVKATIGNQPVLPIIQKSIP